MKLLIQPGAGILPLIKGINRAKHSVEIMIFRFDQTEIEQALVHAVSRGLYVHALIAFTNRGGERNLRNLETRLLAAGVTVSRTADDLVRYHDKFIVIDRRELYLLSFNFTYLDIEHSRCFGVITQNRRAVQEAVKLFAADITRQPYLEPTSALVVSPVNARQRLEQLLRGAKKELLIYDPEISDPSMLQILEARQAAGVEIKIIGRVTRGSMRLRARKLAKMRLHTRTIVRDGTYAFIGSQSLREMELEKRRELGIILRERDVVSRLQKTFAEDWQFAEQFGVEEAAGAGTPVARVAKKVAKAVARELPPIAPVLEVVVKEVAPKVDLDPQQVEETVKKAVKEAVKEAVKDVVAQVAVAHKD